MKRKAMILLACLLLTGCGKREPAQSEQAPAGEMELLLTVDGREVPAWRYLCWLRYACQRVQEQYAAAGQAVDWALQLEEGTLEDLVRQQALADTVLYATVENWAEQYGCQVQAETEGEPLPLPGLTAEQERELRSVGLAYKALYECYCTEGSPLFPVGEQVEAFAGEMGWMKVDRILIRGGEDREAARQRISEMFSRLNGAENIPQTFASLAAEGDDRNGPRKSVNARLDETLLAAAQSLEVGQYSGILETEEGFSILMRLEAEPAEWREAYFDSLLSRAAEGAVVTLQPLYEELTLEKLLSGWEKET